MKQNTPPPRPWLLWALEHGTPQLRRAITDSYPFASMLRRELIELVCPNAHDRGMQRDLELGRMVTLSEEREPNAQSFANLDWITGHRDRLLLGIEPTVHGVPLPEETTIHIGKIRRAWFTTHPFDFEGVRATGLAVDIKCRDELTISCIYFWSRSDKLDMPKTPNTEGKPK